MSISWQPFTEVRGIHIERRGTPATGCEYRIAGHGKIYTCLTCCKREVISIAASAETKEHTT